jgi:hypothetical protein
VARGSGQARPPQPQDRRGSPAAARREGRAQSVCQVRGAVGARSAPRPCKRWRWPAR